ncbi:hypothetical protein [Sorangium sp. So ce1078]|uniref:hypothetical protein n=1 Tax=Sorangium sp. So ce1078 TaxID=3133329 RepID=UPI003F5E7990
MRNHGLMSHDAILELRSAVISAGLTESRRALLAGISAELVASLPDAAAPGAQVLTDLSALRTTGALADGSVPLATWLQNAVALSGPREEAAVLTPYNHRKAPAALRARVRGDRRSRASSRSSGEITRSSFNTSAIFLHAWTASPPYAWHRSGGSVNP